MGTTKVKILQTSIFLLSSFLLAACGSGGGGGESSAGGGGSTTVSAIEDRLWAVGVSSTAYGNCGLVANFSSASKRFGLAWVCQSSGSTYRYEVAFGNYEINGDRIKLTKYDDNCSTYRTIFNNPSDPNSRYDEVTYRVENGNLLLSSGAGLFSFENIGSGGSAGGYIASRGCFAKQDEVYSWISYPQGNNLDENVGAKIQNTTIVPSISGQPVSPIGGCYHLSEVGYGTGAVLTFSGNGGVSPYTGALQAQLQGTSGSLPGVTHTRSNAAGDTMQVYAPQAPGTYSTVHAVVYLAPTTVAYLKSKSLAVCGININSYVSSGKLTMSSQIMSAGGYSGITL